MQWKWTNNIDILEVDAGFFLGGILWKIKVIFYIFVVFKNIFVKNAIYNKKWNWVTQIWIKYYFKKYIFFNPPAKVLF